MRSELDFEEFASDTSDRFFRTAYAITRDHALAEHAVQSALAAAYSRWRKVSSHDPEAYVRRMIVNEILGSGRRRPTSAPTEAPVRRYVASPEQQVVDTDAVWTALLELPVGQRAIIVLCYYERLSEVEIAATLGIRPETITDETSTALANLRRLLTVSRQGARA